MNIQETTKQKYENNDLSLYEIELLIERVGVCEGCCSSCPWGLLCQGVGDTDALNRLKSMMKGDK